MNVSAFSRRRSIPRSTTIAAAAMPTSSAAHGLQVIREGCYGIAPGVKAPAAGPRP